MVDLVIREPFVDIYKIIFCDLKLLFLVGFIYVGFYIAHFFYVLANWDYVELVWYGVVWAIWM